MAMKTHSRASTTNLNNLQHGDGNPAPHTDLQALFREGWDTHTPSPAEAERGDLVRRLAELRRLRNSKVWHRTEREKLRFSPQRSAA